MCHGWHGFWKPRAYETGDTNMSLAAWLWLDLHLWIEESECKKDSLYTVYLSDPSVRLMHLNRHNHKRRSMSHLHRSESRWRNSQRWLSKVPWSTHGSCAIYFPGGIDTNKRDVREFGFLLDHGMWFCEANGLHKTPTCDPFKFGCNSCQYFLSRKTCFLQEPNTRLNFPRCLLLFITSCFVYMFYSGAHQMIRLQGVLGFAVLNAPRPWFEPCFRCCQKGCGLLGFYNISNLSSAMKMVCMINIDKL